MQILRRRFWLFLLFAIFPLFFDGKSSGGGKWSERTHFAYGQKQVRRGFQQNEMPAQGKKEKKQKISENGHFCVNYKRQGQYTGTLHTYEYVR